MDTNPTPQESSSAGTSDMLNGTSGRTDEDDFFAQRRQVQRVSAPVDASNPATRTAAGEQKLPGLRAELKAVVKPEKRKSVKQTIDVSAETHDMLERVSYWKRTPKAVLMNRALNQYLSQIPEAKDPIPPKEEEQATEE